MTSAARALLQRAAVAAAESLPEADDVAVTSKTAGLLAAYAAQLEALLGFNTENEETMQ